ncbi:MAG: threonine/serine exporter family protein [Tissierellales bacterium]|jgi:uncharacterized membrane protein YjjB (DUF3815 family)|nr:threonine/serine exporter family protein [Tissierellales bacterium]
MTFINQFSFAFISTLGFTIIFNIPRKQMVAASLLGSIGWCVYYFYKLSSSPIIAAFWGALIVGFIGEVFARIRKQPATLFIIPGIIPLVPGAGMYYTMYHLVQNDLSKSAQFGIETLMIALSIAIGIILATSVSKAFPRR